MISLKPEIRDSLIPRFQPPKVAQGYLGKSDLVYLSTLEDSNPNKKVVSKSRVFGLDLSRATSFLMPILKTLFNGQSFKITGGNFFRTNVPYRLHADTGIDENAKPFRIVVIPISFELNDPKLPYLPEYNALMISNQRWFHQAAFFMKGEEEKFPLKSQEYNQPVNQYELIYNRQETISRECHAHLFDHLIYDNFEGIDVHSVLSWKPGDILTFDRTSIHTATNFHKANVKTKIALSIFTEYDE